MKKILLATSILAATTGYAAAEVALTGDARMGVIYDGQDVQFSERARVRFNLSGQTDTGLEFGATFRADQAGGSASGNLFGGSDDGKRGTVWISGAFGKLEMGDVVSAGEEAFGDLTSIGFSGLGDFTDIPYISGDGASTLEQGPGALYSYSTGAFEFHLGMTDGSLPNHTTLGTDLGDFIVVGEGEQVDTSYSVAVAYSAGDYKVGLAYLDNGDGFLEGGALNGGSQWIVSGEAEFSGVGVKAYYSSFDDYVVSSLDCDVLALAGLMDKSYGLTVDYTFGATTVSGFARRDEIEASVLSDSDKLDSFGLGAVYDLGGGASLRGGLVNTDRVADVDGDAETIADIGLRLNF